MTDLSCSRKWQVEAALDGRLYGKDLDNALRHRASCADCSDEARELSALRLQLSELPELARDPMVTRRSRQRLMAALNDRLLEPRAPEPKRRTALLFAFGAAAVVAWWTVSHRRAAVEPADNAQSIVEVHARPGARWSEQVNHDFDRVDLTDGAASFVVHPHPGRRVVIQLPDGELEDMGTVFEIRVDAGRTRHVAVRAGRVALRLHGRLEFNLGAGQTWESDTLAPSASVSVVDESRVRGVLPSADPALVSAQDQEVTPRRIQLAPSVGRRGSAPLTVAGALAAQETGEAPRPHNAPTAQSARAEDEAYLHIVELLRQGKQAEARSQAKVYLLEFPSGFRRIEILNIATRSDDSPDEHSER